MSVSKKDENSIRLIMALSMGLQNQVEQVDNYNYKNLLRKRIKDLQSASKKLFTEFFKGVSDDEIEEYDEFSNQIIDLIDLSKHVGLDVSIALLKSAKEGDLIEVDDTNDAVKNQLMYLQNFNKIK